MSKEWKIDWVELNSLTPHPKNRNEHPKEQIERLAQIIDYQGWRHPIIVSKLSGYVVAGHGRLLAARALGLSLVPVHLQDFESTDQEYAFLVSDNAVALWAELDLSGIQADLPDFHLPSVDLLGIKDFEFEATEEESKDSENSKNVCGACGQPLP